MKRIFTGLAIVSAVVYVFFLYYMLFRLPGRQMVIMSEAMLDDYNYWNSVNLIPFTTISEYVTSAIDGNIRGHAIRNLAGNLFLLFPLGFYLPFFARKINKLWLYSIVIAAGIITVEAVQILTMTGSFDVDDFILNFIGAFTGFLFFTKSPVRSIFNLRVW
jgi:glycopeptide antibiotics resistance protein